MSKVAREIPLSEVTLRRYERPSSQGLRELVKRLCLSVGLLQPGDSRDSVVDVFLCFLTAQSGISLEECVSTVRNKRKAQRLGSVGMAESNIRRQVRRLKEQGWISKHQGKYIVTENLSLFSLFAEKIRPYQVDPTVDRIEQYCKAIDKVLEG